MKVINDFSNIIEETVATVGVFDGVHRGHQYLINCLKKEANKSNLKCSVITFSVHPLKILRQGCFMSLLLNTFEEKILRLSLTGVHYCYIIPFNISISSLSAQEFMHKILSQQLRVKKLLVGYDNKFGKDGNTAYSQYKKYGNMAGISVVSIKKMPEKEPKNSSTAIRRFLLEGRPEKASEILSYDYSLEGKVIHGNHLGRTLGVPTANIYLNYIEKIIPREGVYATYVLIKGYQYIGMTYIGKRPTLKSKKSEKRIEVNLFDFYNEIYGEVIRIFFKSFIRPEARFNNLIELKIQLEKDKDIVKNIITSDAYIK